MKKNVSDNQNYDTMFTWKMPFGSKAIELDLQLNFNSES
jgi:hypothetical protein